MDVDNTYILPMHLGMKFKVALGMSYSTALDWDSWLKKLNEVSQKVKFKEITGIPGKQGCITH